MQPLSLTDAYRVYLDRMIDQTDDLVEVDLWTVPTDVDPESPTLAEWCDVT